MRAKTLSSKLDIHGLKTIRASQSDNSRAVIELTGKHQDLSTQVTNLTVLLKALQKEVEEIAKSHKELDQKFDHLLNS